MTNVEQVTFPRELTYINMQDYYGSESCVKLPLLGTVAAGLPILAESNVEDYISVPKTIIRNDLDGFLLRVKGDSMIDAHIEEGDLLICKIQPTAQNGEIVVAVIDGEATVKRFFHEGKRIRLQPENRKYKPIYVSADFIINGKVVGLIRTK